MMRFECRYTFGDIGLDRMVKLRRYLELLMN